MRSMRPFFPTSLMRKQRHQLKVYLIEGSVSGVRTGICMELKKKKLTLIITCPALLLELYIY